jgi:hypothetical protein
MPTFVRASFIFETSRSEDYLKIQNSLESITLSRWNAVGKGGAERAGYRHPAEEQKEKSVRHSLFCNPF